MIQCYKINGLYVIEDTVRDDVYCNLTEEQAKIILEAFGREKDRTNFPLKERRYYENRFSRNAFEIYSLLHPEAEPIIDDDDD